MSHRTRQLTVAGLARVEGEGALRVTIRDGQVEQAELHIYEPPRFFEAFLRGRSYTEPPDITARICGICPVAYQTSACNAIEQACGAELDPPLADLRRLLYCGEWISSHALHIYLLHAPDFLGYPDAIALARDHRDIVERGLALKKTGNAMLEFVGGRAIHPVNVRVGGFYRVPTRGETAPHRRAAAPRAGRWRWTRSGGSSTFDFPDLELEPRPAGRCTIPAATPSRTAASRPPSGLSFTASEFPGHVTEEQVPHSTALHASAGRPPLPDRAAGQVLAQLGLPVPRRARRQRPTRGSARSAATPSAASWSAPSRSSTRSRRRCASSTATSGRTVPRSRWRRAREPGTASARHPGACSTTATSSTPTA